MLLGDYRVTELDAYKDLRLEDVGLFRVMIDRMIEDIDLAAFIYAKSRNRNELKTEEARATLHLIDSDADEAMDKGPLEGIVRPARIRDFTKAPIPHTDEAVQLFSKFLNFRLIKFLSQAAEAARKEGSTSIRLRHLVPFCEKLPFPLNLLC